eukprot:403346677
MSIFQIKELWSTNVGNNEEFDKGSITIGNVDNQEPAENKIVVASFEGILRVYRPQAKAYNVNDMLLEKNLNSPVLQLEIGKFSYACDYSLAILHLRKIVIAQITSTDQFSNYRVIYEHSFDRNAYNFISGTFGKSQKQIICVQSVDGALFFYEHETLLYQIQLPDFLIPGPLIYASAVDSIIITNTNLELESYRFQSLQAFTNNNIASQKQMQQDEQSSRLQPDWTCNIGEQAHHLVYHDNKISKRNDIVVVGEQSFFIVQESDGNIRYQRRLEYTPSCIKTYHIPGQNKDIFENEDRQAQTVVSQAINNQHDSPCFSFIMGSFSHYLMIYKDVQLVWTAKTQTAPIYVNTAKISGVDGLIVTLSDNGWLQIVYLGTESPAQQIHSIGQGDKTELNYSQMDMEHQRLLARIRNHEDEKQVEPEEKIVINAQLASFVEATRDYIDDPKGVLAKNDKNLVLRMSLKITLGFKGSGGNKGCFRNILLQLNLPSNVYAETTVYKFENINFGGNQTPPVIKVHLYPLKSSFPIETKISISSTYQQVQDLNQQGQGTLRTSMTEVNLPLQFFVQIGAQGASKEASDFKLNLVLNKPTSSAVSLFEDVVESLQARELCTNKKQITFLYHNIVPVSLLVSKDDLKIRIQSPDFCSIWYVTNELIKRLNELLNKGKNINYNVIIQFVDNDLEISFADAIPLNELFNVIDEHYQIRMDIIKLRKLLEDRSYQFRTIQKRLLNRFKDKNPSPLNNLDFLLNHTYTQIIDTASQIEQLQLTLKSVSLKLSAAVEIILLLLKVRFRLTEEEYEAFRMHLSPYIDDESEQGWEDITNAAMTNLLKTCLAKGGKAGGANSNLQQASNQIKTLQDVAKLKQHITLVCDRISKGGRVEY